MTHAQALTRLCLVVCAITLLQPAAVQAYIEAPYTLGKVVEDSSHIVLLEVERVNREKGLIVFRKLRDLRGEWPEQQIKHNIGQRGFHEREWQRILQWAEAGKQAVFFCQGDASETCIDGYWYQCYREEAWWGLSHGEPYLLRTYIGPPKGLAELIVQMQQGQQVLAPCLADGDRDQLQLGQGKLQRCRASLTRLDYQPRRDFAGWGLEGPLVDEVGFEQLLPAGADQWRYIAARRIKVDQWKLPSYSDHWWSRGKAPLGYGEDQIAERGSRPIAIRGRSILARHAFEVPEDLLGKTNLAFTLQIASDNSAAVYLNGNLVHDDRTDDHEFAYWNHTLRLERSAFVSGNNVLAAEIVNHRGSSDLFFDAELFVTYDLTPSDAFAVADVPPDSSPALHPPEEQTADSAAAQQMSTLTIDRAAGTVALTCWVAPRKLAHLQETYPLEVAATLPHPQGQKAHETILVFRGVKPSEVHATLEQLGLKAGQPALGERGVAEGPEVEVLLQPTNGAAKFHPLSDYLIDRSTGEVVRDLHWRFTGSVRKQPDPEQDESVYGADLTGTLLTLFPVTDCCVLQTGLTKQDESTLRLEGNGELLPAEGSPMTLMIKRIR